MAASGGGEGGWEGEAAKGEQNIVMWSVRTRSGRFGLSTYFELVLHECCLQAESRSQAESKGN